MRIIAIALTSAALCLAQSPAFEVASIKVNNSGSRGASGPGLKNGTLRAVNVTMRAMLKVAFGLSNLQIVGPAWIDSDRYDISAKSPRGIPDTELKPMLQALLKTRFQLAEHSETKEMAVYDLVVAKRGLKIVPFDPDHPMTIPPYNGSYSKFVGILTMSDLADAITPFAGRPVLNKTGLTERYGCSLSFSPVSTEAPGIATGPGAVDIFAALEQQAGLKLEPKRESVEILVVDSADRVPTED